MDNNQSEQLISNREQDYGTVPLVNKLRHSNVIIDTNNLRKRILLGLIVFLVLGFAAAAYVFCVSHQQTTEFKTDPQFSSKLSFPSCHPTCQTKWCDIYAKILNSTSDLSVDPCEDFYEHVCANWNPSLPQLSYWDIQLENTHDIVQFALDDDRNMSSFSQNSKSKLIRYMARLYQDWMDVSKREQIDMARQLILGDTQLSLFGSASSKKNNPYVIDYRKTINSPSDFFKMWNSWNATNVEQWMDSFVEASLVGVDTIFKYIRVSDRKIYILFNDKAYGQENYSPYRKFEEHKNKISLFFKIDKAQWDSSLNYVLFEMIDFELKLGEIYKEFKIVRGDEYYYPLTDLLEETNNSSTAFNWTLFLSKFASRTGTSTHFLGDENVQVVTQDLELLTAIAELISSTPIRVLKNVMSCHYIDTLKILTRKLLFIQQNPSYVASEMNRHILWHEFVDKDFTLFLPLYTRLFVDYVGRERMSVARNQANEIMENMKRTFGESLKHTWLDEKTRVKAWEKVNAMSSMISHPDWILNDTALDEEFGFDIVGENFAPIKGNFVGSYLNFLRIVQSAHFRKLDRDDSKHNQRKFDFTFDYIGLSIFDTNHISVTHALLLDPSFNVDYPIELNYAHLGTIISHELIHGFDNEGIKHDKSGEEINWWTDYAAEQYENRSQCFVQQYEKFGGNGTLTLGENISDNGGLNLAYRLFEKHLNHSQIHCNASSLTLPPFLAQYSHQQLFFLAYGLERCSHRNFSSTWDGDEHSPLKYRVNIPLQNSDKFAQAFNCPVGSKMNPEKKCLLW